MIKTFFLGLENDVDFQQNFTNIQTELGLNCSLEILEMKNLDGTGDLVNIDKLFYAKQQGIRPRFCKIGLNNGKMIVNAGCMYIRAGNIQAKVVLRGGNNKPGLSGVISNLARSILTNDTFMKSEYYGTGSIWLEPTFDHFIIFKLTKAHGPLICDKGMFYACETSINISLHTNTIGGVANGEPLFQTKLEGDGLVLIKTPVPSKEIMVFMLQKDTLHIDGNFTILHSGFLEHTISCSMDGLVGTMISGEGLLQTFRGTGLVYTAPTTHIYGDVSSHISTLDTQNPATTPIITK